MIISIFNFNWVFRVDCFSYFWPVEAELVDSHDDLKVNLVCELKLRGVFVAILDLWMAPLEEWGANFSALNFVELFAGLLPIMLILDSDSDESLVIWCCPLFQILNSGLFNLGEVLWDLVWWLIRIEVVEREWFTCWVGVAGDLSCLSGDWDIGFEGKLDLTIQLMMAMSLFIWGIWRLVGHKVDGKIIGGILKRSLKVGEAVLRESHFSWQEVCFR